MGNLYLYNWHILFFKCFFLTETYDNSQGGNIFLFLNQSLEYFNTVRHIICLPVLQLAIGNWSSSPDELSSLSMMKLNENQQ